MQLVQLGLEAFSMVNGSRAGSPLIYSLTRRKGKVLNGKNSSLLFLPAHYGTPTLPANAFNSGVITRTLLLSLNRIIPKPLGSWIWFISYYLFP